MIKKFNKMNEISGSRDVNGNWVDETIQAKLRNKLGPFWTLSTILSENSDILNTEKGLNIVKDLAKTCEENKQIIIDLIDKTENK